MSPLPIPQTLHDTQVDAPGMVDLVWQQGFAKLGADFVVPLSPAPLPAPYWVGHSDRVARDLGLPTAWSSSDSLLHALTGNQLLPGSAMHAGLYGGHRFGDWAGQVGDAQACMLGQLAGQEIQLKGSGPTPFSGLGDGRTALRSTIREFLCSQAMHGLRIPSTGALCVTGSDAAGSGQEADPAGVLTRVAASFIRFGHFEYLSQRGQLTQLQTLADFVIDHHYPHCRDSSHTNSFLALLREVTLRTAQLLAHWQTIGFCHGLMDTENMSILGLTLDCDHFQFLDAYFPGHVCSPSDTKGRYAFSEQPNMAYWNLYCLTDALLPLINDEAAAAEVVDSYKEHFQTATQLCLARKMGLNEAGPKSKVLSGMLLPMLAADRVDHTIFWRRLSLWAERMDDDDNRVADLFINRQQMQTWQFAFQSMHQTLGSTDVSGRMLRSNPKYLLRDHLAEQAITAAKGKDFSVLKNLQTVLEHPFDEHPEFEGWAGFAPDAGRPNSQA